VWNINLKKRKVIYQKGLGRANIEHGVSAQPSTVFRIGSITKQFTAVAILQLFKDSNAPTPWQMRFIRENEFICYEVFPNTHIFSKDETGDIDFLIIKDSTDYETKVMRSK
jgi:hypothetical protein